MFLLDIRTLGLISMITSIVLAMSMVTIWRLVPRARSLQDWAVGAVLIAVGTLLIALRNVIPDSVSIAVANAMNILGMGYIHMGVHGLLGRIPNRKIHWPVAGMVLLSFIYFGQIEPSLTARIVLSSLAFAPYMAACAWLFWRYGDVDLKATQRLTAVVFGFGAILFFARAIHAPFAVVSADYTTTTDFIIAAPYLFSILFNVSLAVTVSLGVSARLQRNMMEARDKAEAANVAKSQFLATMSHEIRTPLNGILGMAQLLQMPDLTESERTDFAKVIMNSGNSLMTLLNDILDLSKIEAGKMDINEVEFAVFHVVDEVRDLMADMAAKKGLAFSTEWQGMEGLRILGDPLRLRQMLTNLVGNAIKFTPSGGIKIVASVLSQVGSNMTLRFAVTDTGIGVADEDRKFLFKAFSQVDSSATRRFEGTGLGLSIVRSLAEQMHGEVGVESLPGQGSSFWFTVQVKKLIVAEPVSDTTGDK